MCSGRVAGSLAYEDGYFAACVASKSFTASAREENERPFSPDLRASAESVRPPLPLAGAADAWSGVLLKREELPQPEDDEELDAPERLGAGLALPEELLEPQDLAGAGAMLGAEEPEEPDALEGPLFQELPALDAPRVPPDELKLLRPPPVEPELEPEPPRASSETGVAARSAIIHAT